MAVTGTCSEVFYLTLPEEIEVEGDPISQERATSSFRERFKALPEDQQIDIDVDDNVF